ncbi:NupC/NupG family nucleoside CNT transporter [Brevibacillus sp. DP1.3A]|uniref:NupC/NupG family nucleoside CNT transporter n=1 Tax=unclassified Brevibacillus TaxID=2684853 RepID=UPI00156B8985|nr:nucleoside transporter C-terminal domain-containing protein [Brevibacillus sp. DP1.3A]UED75003.1 NupC/NupG family nucleoside CNT transporter [Brevibacillus sp. DP1.3A]
MNYIIAGIGLITVFLLAWLASSNKKRIRYRPILIMILIQIVFGLLLLRTNIGLILISGVASSFSVLLEYAYEGINFVFGGIANPGASPFFLQVLLPIVFVSALIGILQYTRILPLFIHYVGLVLSKVNGMGKLESYNAIASAIVGQSEVFITVKKQLGAIPENRLYTLCASAMSTVSMSIVGSFMTMLKPEYVVAALVLNLFGGFIIASIITPYEVKPEDDLLDQEKEERQAFFEMLGEYILDGFKVAVVVAAMLLGFIAIIAMVNGLFSAVFGISFQALLGYAFAPLAFLMGVPWHEAVQAGSIMATKIVANEFVAILDFTKIQGQLSERTVAIVSVFLISFANFGSIGTIVGAVKGLNERQGNVVARFGLKLLYGATLVSILSGIIISIVV